MKHLIVLSILLLLFFQCKTERESSKTGTNLPEVSTETSQSVDSSGSLRDKIRASLNKKETDEAELIDCSIYGFDDFIKAVKNKCEIPKDSLKNFSSYEFYYGFIWEIKGIKVYEFDSSLKGVFLRISEYNCLRVYLIIFSDEGEELSSNEVRQGCDREEDGYPYTYFEYELEDGKVIITETTLTFKDRMIDSETKEVRVYTVDSTGNLAEIEYEVE